MTILESVRAVAEKERAWLDEWGVARHGLGDAFREAAAELEFSALLAELERLYEIERAYRIAQEPTT